MREDAIVLHPLPRVDELDFSLDGDPRAAYFRQASYGVPVRMALIAALLNLREVSGFAQAAPEGELWRPLVTDMPYRCANARCITQVEPGITPPRARACRRRAPLRASVTRLRRWHARSPDSRG